MSDWPWTFRRRLGEALSEWEREGLISPESARLIRLRHELAVSDADERANLLVYLFGAILLFGGVSSFVAWNWSAIPGGVKLACGGALMVGLQLAGWWLGWVDGKRRGLGHGLVLAGVLMFGANLGLLAQVFHLEAGATGYLAFAAAASAVALSLKSLPSAGVAAFCGFAWLWSGTYDATQPSLLVFHAVWAAVVAAAYAFRSSTLALLGIVGGTVTVLVGLDHSWDPGAGGMFALPLFFSALAFAISHHFEDTGSRLRNLAGAFTLFAAFGASFEEPAHAVAREADGEALLQTLTVGGPVLLVLAALVVVAFRLRRIEASDALVVVGVAAFGLAPFLGEGVFRLLAHVVIVGRVAWDLRRSLDELSRAPFWSALLLGLGLIGARFFEIQAGLLTKAVVFMIAGVAVLVAGHAFEQRRNAELPHAS